MQGFLLRGRDYSVRNTVQKENHSSLECGPDRKVNGYKHVYDSGSLHWGFFLSFFLSFQSDFISFPSTFSQTFRRSTVKILSLSFCFRLLSNILLFVLTGSSLFSRSFPQPLWVTPSLYSTVCSLLFSLLLFCLSCCIWNSVEIG